MQTSNWVKAGDRQRYGQGQVYAFSHPHDAMKWAAKMDWEFNKDIGSGKVSVLKVKRGPDWQPDPAQHDSPIESFGAKGEWLRQMKRVPASDIVASVPLT